MVGVSRDSVASHQKFKTKYGLDFPLLADASAEIHKAFGVGGLLGSRVTFVIDADGRIVKVWPKVRVDGHADDVYASLP